MCNYGKIEAKLGKFQFVTVGEYGSIGSVYFEKGRIRLIHKHGPYASKNISEQRDDRYTINRNNPKETQCKVELEGVLSNIFDAMNKAKVGNVLYEKNSNHVSRGYPCSLLGQTGTRKNLLEILNDHFDELLKWESGKKIENHNNLMRDWVGHLIAPLETDCSCCSI